MLWKWGSLSVQCLSWGCVMESGSTERPAEPLTGHWKVLVRSHELSYTRRIAVWTGLLCELGPFASFSRLCVHRNAVLSCNLIAGITRIPHTLWTLNLHAGRRQVMFLLYGLFGSSCLVSRARVRVEAFARAHLRQQSRVMNVLWIWNRWKQVLPVPFVCFELNHRAGD